MVAPTSSAPAATHLQLLLQQHHALQRREQEAKERLEQEKQLQLQREQKHSSTPASSASSSSSSNLKADAQSVAAYMAAYMKFAAASADRARDESATATSTINPVVAPATIAPSSTMLYSSPPSPSLSSFSSSTSASPKVSAAQTKAASKSGKSHSKHPSLSFSDTAAVEASSVDTASDVSKSANPHRQECYNCGVTKTPLWRRTHDRQHSLCNACGLYYKQYKSNRPLASRSSKDSTSSVDSTSQQEQQSKRRKISDAESGVSVKSEPSAEGSRTTHLKQLLPHPPAPQERLVLPQMLTTSHNLMGARGYDSETGDQSETDDEEGEWSDSEQMNEDPTDQRGNDERDVDMAEAQADHEMGEDDDSDDSDYGGHQRESEALTDTEETEVKKVAGSSGLRSGRKSGAPLECANCGQTQTPLWRKDAKGQPICNACGLYSRLHHRDRPITMRKTKITRRKRDWSAAHERVSANSPSDLGNFDIANKKKKDAAAKKKKEKASVNSDASMAEDTSSNATKKRKEQVMSEGHVEVRAMNIPVSSEHESDDSSLCLLDHNTEDHAVSQRVRRKPREAFMSHSERY
ncbi:hypothetical protein BC939DRAFT_93810 [Gamsiella multidivaricata]|uniref:uncharacterized protein n=1 Tax=Gamsiella multidivaricata TaxID=101098 RepID=UPI0022202C19|nr:uncharacterized protein BC939DRAFT_93810 [Gamsiella multidivaricata]KAI7827070.1 hypothetical protein BC939DRAFT_93810 [Gamsiella multidivaricata]